MSSDSEEVEIKIEYNESFETDPLCDNFEMRMPVKCCVDNRTNFDQFDLQNNTVLETNSEDSGNSDYQESTEEIPSENQATWYKLIDQNGRYLCQFCNLTYSTIQTLRHHIKIKHPENVNQLKNQILNNKRNRKLKCHICKTRFKELKILKEHVKRTHELENLQISCKNCDATFSSQKEMAEHLFHKHKIKEHQLFSCLTCGYRTSKKSHFRQHKNTHSELKLLKCQFCEYSTNYLPNLNIHVRIHTNQKPYKCDFKECSYNCAAKSALRSHQLKHNRDENFLYCDKCSYKTVYKQSLKKHIESHQRNSIRLKL